jgi:hypothetical protein
LDKTIPTGRLENHPYPAVVVVVVVAVDNVFLLLTNIGRIILKTIKDHTSASLDLVYLPSLVKVKKSSSSGGLCCCCCHCCW